MKDWPTIDAYIAKRITESKLDLNIQTLSSSQKILFLIKDAYSAFHHPSHASMPEYYEKALPKGVQYVTPDIMQIVKKIRDDIQKMSAEEHISEVIGDDGKTKINVAQALAKINESLEFSEEVNSTPPPKIPLSKSKIKKIRERRLKNF